MRSSQLPRFLCPLLCSLRIGACAKSGNWQWALQLFAMLRHDGLRGNVVTCNSLISACEKGGEWSRALALLSGIQGEDVQAQAVQRCGSELRSHAERWM